MKRTIVRLPEDIVARVDLLAREALPGRRGARAAALRALVARGLAMVDAAGGQLEGAAEAVVAPGPTSTRGLRR